MCHGHGAESVKDFARKHTIAIAVGAFLAATPLLAFDYWLSGLIERQTLDDITTSAKRAVGLAETRVGQAVSTLDGLAERGVNSCAGPNLDAMRSPDAIS